MPILAMSSGTVTAVWGQAFLRLPNGQLRAVKVGDKVVGGQQIITEDNGLVQIAPDTVRTLPAQAAKPLPADAVIADLNNTVPLDPPGGGLQGGLAGSLSSGLRVDRIAEGVTPLAFDFGTERVLPPPIFAVTAPQASTLAAAAAPVTPTPTPEPEPTQPQLSINDVRVNEGAGVATFTISLDQPATQPVTVTYTSRSGTAVVGTGEGTDAGVVTQTVTIPTGNTSVDVTVPIANDGTYERSETFQVVLSQPVNATIAQGTGTGTILDDGTGTLGLNQTAADDDRPAVQIAAGPAVVEGQPAVFTLSLTHPSNFPVDVALKLLTGAVDPVTGQGQYITPGVDSTPLEVLNPTTGQWEPLSGALVFQPGTTSLQVRVPTLNDGAVEGTEIVGLQATATGDTVPGGAGPLTAAVTVRDNDAEATVYESGLSTTVPSGDDTTRASGPVPLVDAQGRPVAGTVTAPTQAVTTASGQTVVWKSDGNGGLIGYAGSAPNARPVATLTLSADGQYSFELRQPLQHANGQTDLTLDFGLTPNAAGSVPDATLRIHVIDAQPALPAMSIDSVTVNEGAGVATFTISLDQPATQPVTVTYTSRSGTAVVGTGEGTDAGVVTQTVTIPTGNTSVDVTVPIANDGTYERSETFQVVLSQPVNATIAQGTGTGTILDDGTGTLGLNQTAADDDRPAVQIAAGPAVVEGQPAVFTLSLTHPSNFPVDVALKLLTGAVDPVTGQGQYITPGVDSTPLEVLNPTTGQWEPLSGALVFQPGTTSLQVRVPTLNDGAVEGTEIVGLQATATGDTVPGGAGPLTAAVTVRDNDAEGTVYESSLAGITTPTPAIFKGSLGVVDTGDQPVPVTLQAPTDALFTSISGQKLVWTTEANGDLVARAGTTADAPLAARVSTDGQGGVSFSLLQAIQHADGSGVRDIQFAMQPVGATTDAGNGTLTIHVTDDQPRLPATIDVAATTLDTNLLLVLDTSSAMSAASGVGDLTRLQAAVKSLTQLIDRYDQFGEVAVRLVTFSGTAQAQTDQWLSAGEAKALLAALNAGGSNELNHAVALLAARDAFDSAGKLADAQNVSYFLAGGNPSDLGGVSPLTANGWTSFLNEHQIKSQAVGLGAEVGPSGQAALDAIAYDGQASSDLSATLITAFDGLTGALNSSTRDTISGRLINAATSAGGLVGADGFAHVGTVTVDGVTHDFVAAQDPVKSFTTNAGGVFTVNMLTSEYSYAAPSGSFGQIQEQITFTLVDHDGDAGKSVLNINLDHTDVRVGTSADNVISGDGSSQFMMGREGNDTLTGSDGSDILVGNAGNDELRGGLGRDTLVGGAGNDQLEGGQGSDVFAWRFSDAGTPMAPAEDHVRDFGAALPNRGGDVLDLRDLLQGEHGSSGLYNIGQYIHINAEAGSTVIRVSSIGDFSTTDANMGAADQRIVLDNVDLVARLGAGLSEQQLIAKLVEQGKLLVDA
ncbi:MAG: type I secretion C-terminal target domain-containing protein [Aquabacterium sp.]|nr:type I secretion C-terminal target domain-containing protein [Aquabacterium sp.]